MQSRELNKLEVGPALGADSIERIEPDRAYLNRQDRRPPAIPQALSSGPDAIGLLKAFRRRWASAVGVGIVCAVAVAAVAWSVLPPPKYTAYATLRVDSRPPQVAFTILETRTETKDELDKYQRTQLELVKSRLVLNEALRQPHIAALPSVRDEDDPLEWLDKDLQVQYANDSDILKVALKGKRPKDLAEIVNAIVDAYLREVVSAEDFKRRNRLAQLEEIYADSEKNLTKKRETLRQLAELAGSNDQKTLQFKQQLELERHSMAEKELMQFRSELRKARAELAAVEARAKSQSEIAALGSEFEAEQLLANDPQYQDILKRIQKIEANIRQTQRLARGAYDPALRRFRTELAQEREKRDAYRRAFEEDRLRQAKQRASDEDQDRLTAARDRVTVLEGLVKAAQEDAKQLAAETRSSNKKTLDLQSRQDEIEQVSKVYKKVGEDIEALKVELRAEQRVKPVERAEVPRKKEDKRPLMTAALSGGAFLAILLGFSWWEFQARRIDSAEDVVLGLGMQLVGALPALPDRVRRPSSGPLGARVPPRDIYWQNLLLESIDATRTMVLHALRDGSCRVLMITSALKGEGKTSLACHLARSLARAGRRTLLVDCDLRTPSVHRVFGEPLDPGFCELLRGEVLASDVIRPTSVNGLCLMTAGQCDARALQSLAHDRVGVLFAGLKERFDFVVVDTAPALPVTDTLLVGQHADGVLFSILRDVSRLPKVHMAYERLGTLGIRMLGAVVAGARMDRHEYGAPLWTEER